MAVRTESVHHGVRQLAISRVDLDFIDSAIAGREIVLGPVSAVIRSNKNLARAGECAARRRIDRVRIRFSDPDRVDKVSAVSESIAAGIADRRPGVTTVCRLPNSVRPVENAIAVPGSTENGA